MSVRCVICDWSPTNKQSLFNPRIETYGYNKLYIDEKTGHTTCIQCIDMISGSTGTYVKGFKAIANDDRRGNRGASEEDSWLIHGDDMPEDW